MHIAKATLESTTPYSQSKNIDPQEHPKKSKETHDAYEQRTWRHRIHSNTEGFVEIPPTAFANAVKSSARRLQTKVPGKGTTQYTKYFEAGVDVMSSLVLSVKTADIVMDRLFVPSDGKAGGGKRVYKNFPRVDKWRGVVTFLILDDIITQDEFTKVLQNAGLLVGIGRFRPENRGFYGRFKVNAVEWIEDGDAAIGAAAE